jgi:hypothetical protein
LIVVGLDINLVVATTLGHADEGACGHEQRGIVGQLVIVTGCEAGAGFLVIVQVGGLERLKNVLIPVLIAGIGSSGRAILLVGQLHRILEEVVVSVRQHEVGEGLAVDGDGRQEVVAINIVQIGA